MGLEKVLSISGKPGLYELTAQTRGGFIAKSITEGKKISVNVRHNVSLLSEIAVYTYTEEVPLGTIFTKIYEKEEGKPAISPKVSSKELEAYFAEVLPDYDVDRVYQSDIKKVIQWYNLLVTHGYTDFTKEETDETKVEAKAENASEENAATKPEAKSKSGSETKASAKSKDKPDAKPEGKTADKKEAKPAKKANKEKE